NPGRDTLVVVGVRSDVAASASLHESMQMGKGAGAMMHMAPLAAVTVAPGDSIVFAPLGRHAMLEQLRRPLAVGDSVPFALAVTSGGRAGAARDTIRATAVVRAF
ncbi:MAG TPA: copper chaperone PCu(A)C, partial [Gemmatirosa sp.]